MGYVIGGRSLIKSASESDFRNAVNDNQISTGVSQIPNITPKGTYSIKKGANNASLRQAQGATLDISRTAPTFNDPRYTSSTLAIPTDERTLHGLYRFFAETDPIVGAALKIHGELPLADLGLGTCEDTGVQLHFEEMWEDRIGGVRMLNDIVGEYHEIGNVFPFGAFNESDYMWDQFAILNPDYVKVESTWINQNPLIKLLPDEALKRVVQTQSPRYIYDQLPPEIVRYVLFNQEIPLDPNNVFMLANLKRPYENKGRSVIKRILKTLMLEDRFNQANFALATRHSVPLTVVKVGDPTSVEENHFITYLQDDILKVETFKDMWELFPDAKIIITDLDKEAKDVRSYNLTTQSLGANGKLDWNPIDYILRHPTPEGRMVEMDTVYGTIRSTDMHGFMWINPDTLEYEKVNPLELAKRPKPSIVTSDKFDFQVESDSVFGYDIDTDFAYLIGLWTADGSFSQGPNNLLISNHDIGVVEKAKELFDRIGGTDIEYRDYGSERHVKVVIPELKLALLEYYGLVDSKERAKTGKEDMPQDLLFNSNAEIIGSCLAGVFDGDGYINSELSRLVISTGDSLRFHQLLSLSLLSQGIESKILPKGTSQGSNRPCWELTIRGKTNTLKALDLIEKYVAQTKKKHLILELRDHYSTRKAKLWNIDTYDISKENIDELFVGVDPRFGHGERYTSYMKRLKALPKNMVDVGNKESNTYKKLENVHTIDVNRVSSIESESEYVYDLMLRDDPHVYLVGNQGWVCGRNTGWLPNDEELEAVRDQMCYDDQTEVLTKNGWKWHTDVKKDEKIACFDDSTNSLVYDIPSHLHESDYDGDMYHFNSKCTDIMVTPNHRMHAKHRKNEYWEILRADAVTQDFKFRACVDDYQHNNLPETINIADKDVDMLAWFAFAGWYISEGSIQVPGSSVNVSQTKEKGRIEIESILDILPWEWNYWGYSYVICNKKLQRFVKSEFGSSSQTKKVPRWMMDAPAVYLHALFNAYIAGDGTRKSYKNGSKFTQSSTTSKLLNDDIQEIAFKLGYSARYTITEDPIFYDPISKTKKLVRDSGKRKGEAYDTIYKMYCSTDTNSRFPGFAWAVKENVGKCIPDVSNIPSPLPMKGKKYIWKDIDLVELLSIFGSADAVGKYLSISGTTVRNQMNIQNIPISNPGCRNPNYVWEDNDNIKRVHYEGKVWCFTVPTGLFITRRNGRVAIQGNSNYELDPNFCYDEVTECLTKDGWKFQDQLTYEDEIASFNANTNGMEYALPELITRTDYDGDMYHFNSRSMDMKVTPNHRMWLKRNDNWQIQLAEDVKTLDKFRTTVDNYQPDTMEDTLNISGEIVNTADFFEYAGWYLSEGSVYFEKTYEKHRSINITQTKESGRSILEVLHNNLPWGFIKTDEKFQINNTVFATYVAGEFGKYSQNKVIPRWMMNAPAKYLQKIFDAWMLGDGTSWEKKDNDTFKVGYSTSEALIDSMQEIAIKLGYACRKRELNAQEVRYPGDAPDVRRNTRADGTPFLEMWALNVTKEHKMSYPIISNRNDIEVLPDIVVKSIPKKGNRLDWDNIDLLDLLEQAYGVVSTVANALGVEVGTIHSQIESQELTQALLYIKQSTDGYVRGGRLFNPKQINKVHYEGKIWCVTVPTGIIITRRNGRIAVQGQSLIYHYGIDIEYYGSNGKMLPINPELERLYRMKFIGLGVHEQLLTGQGGSYAQAYISMEVQRQRYLNLQLKLENFVHNGIFKPVADLCGFYKVHKSVVGSSYSSKNRYGSSDSNKREMMKQFSGLRDYQDNAEFSEFIKKKSSEYDEIIRKEQREYVYPELDFGGLSAAHDENMKNYVKWLAEKRPHLVDDATLAGLAKLDRDDQMRAFAGDIERNKNLYYNLKAKGLLEFLGGKEGLFGGDASGGGPGDLGGIGLGLDGDPGGAPMGFGDDAIGMDGDLDMGDIPIGEGGESELAGGITPPPGMASMERDMLKSISKEEALIIDENTKLLGKKASSVELKKIIGMRDE